ncbi:hypothetical protein LRAMOSA03808 [Lichtheimia ramosa]|uniref:Uncharacterized protein n=1 Tax=Lichtheimia ramosa TaxID=688394 RepID=A0A077WW82_9FUNG|nr:hypothetical protein LRAMOSA03808 [Lichtheimia ramosa]
MIKRTSHQAFSPNNQGIVVLYDHAKQDAFAATEHANQVHMLLGSSGSTCKQRIPSITTIMLLQMQVSMIQMIGSISSSKSTAVVTHTTQPSTPLPEESATKKSTDHPTRYHRVAAVKGCLQKAARWSLLFGLVVLDNVGRALGVEEEMAHVCEQEQQQVHHYQPYLVESQQQQQQHVSFHDKNNNDAVTRVPSPPTNTTPTLSAPPPPIMINPQQPRASSSTHTHSVSPAHAARTRKISAPTGSSNSSHYPHHHRHDCNTSPSSVTQPMGHVRSLSNNMTMPASKMTTSRHSLRRIEAQRDLVSVKSSSSSSTSSLHHRRRVEEDDSENVPSQIHYHHHHHFHQDPSKSGTAIRTTTTTTNGSPSSTKRNGNSSTSQKMPWRP